MLGDSTDAVIQGTIVFVLGSLLGMRLDLIMFLEILPVMLLITFGLVSIGLTVASFMESLESYGAIQSFINLPLFFLSGALFPIRGETVQSWIQTVSVLNPLTYGVDALRIIILRDAWQSLHSLFYDVLIIGCFDLVMIAIGTRFWQTKIARYVKNGRPVRASSHVP